MASHPVCSDDGSSDNCDCFSVGQTVVYDIGSV